MVIGVTGNYCSGKNIVSKYLEELGFSVVDVDKIGHEALEVKKDDIVKVFGEEIISNGRIDRKKLGKKVFSDKNEIKKLERIVHPWMIREVKKRVSKKGNWVINAALLIEMCLFVLCDFTIGVDTPREIAVMRGISRDGISREEAERRLDAQIPLKEKKHYVDIVIENNGSIEDLKDMVSKVLEKFGIKV